MTQSTPKFRGNSVIAFEDNDTGIRVWMREIKAIAAKGETAETVRILPEMFLPYADCSGAVLEKAKRMGLMDRLRDGSALPQVNGRPQPIQAKYDAVKEILDHLKSGAESWELVGKSTSLSADVRALCLAIQRAYGLDAEAAETAVRAMSTEARDKLRVDAEIKPFLDAVYAERAKSTSAEDVDAIKERLRKLKAGA